MASVFWDAKRIIMIDHTEKGVITGSYYSPADEAAVTMTAVQDAGFELVEHTRRIERDLT